MGAEPESAWSANTITPHDECDPVLRTRTLLFSQSYVIFACDLDLESFLEGCKTHALVVEVHDRDARPVQRVIPVPYEEPPEPAPVGEAAPEAASTKKGKGVCLAPASSLLQ